MLDFVARGSGERAGSEGNSKEKGYSDVTQEVSVSGIRAKEALVCIRKRHVLDAIQRLETSSRKVCKLLIKTFYNMLNHAEQKGVNPMRLWVHGYILGKTKRWKGLRDHAKGRGCREKRDYCQVKIILGEKPEKDFYEEIGTGKCAPGVAAVIRYALKQTKADYH